MGKKPTKLFARVKEYLRHHPYACGDSGVADYNRRYGDMGEITVKQLYNARVRFKEELGLHRPEIVSGSKGGRPPNSLYEFIISFVGQGVPPSDIAAQWNLGGRGRKHVDVNYIESRLRGVEELILTPDIPPQREECSGNVVTIDHLTDAIKASIDRKGLSEEAARDMAKHIMNFFGYEDRIIDNVLEPEDRDAFYMLEDAGLLTTEREETILYDGSEWRIHYWLFRMDRITALLDDEKSSQKLPNETDFMKIYGMKGDVPEDVWSNRSVEVVSEQPQAMDTSPPIVLSATRRPSH